jgi:aerotaxis receptor
MMPERRFELDELFISTTDSKGHIRLSNRVFVRVSGYTADELAGRAHNIIRHPDMPRALFAAFWERLLAHRPVAAYVKNRAKNGDHYWVMAVAVPVPGGYASVRLKPTDPELFPLVKDLYAELVALERSVEGDEPRRRKAAIAASSERLAELLAAAGYETYEAFMHRAMVAEVTRRAAAVGESALAPLVEAAPDADPRLAQVLSSALELRRGLDGMLSAIAGNSAVATRLATRSGFVRELSDDLRLFALNAMLAASRLEDGGPLSAIAGLQSARFDALAPRLESLGAALEQAGGRLDEMGFRAAACHVQAEMMAVFAGEHLDDEELSPEMCEQLTLLTHAVSDAAGSLREGLAALDAAITRIDADARRVHRELDIVRALEVNGRIEAARATGTEHVRTLFTEMGARIASARSEVAEFLDLDQTLGRDAALEHRTRKNLEAVDAAVTALTGPAQPRARPLT